ncbi:5'-3' exoribonuclease 1 isoform X2 [Homalodisca vitripennis]|uniref:5'-3' exoribonuclease 1 isoform X2 n=1 Tax=Homalodisca vitripennis TaxID=197043 RepID=UPI001EEACBFE|nr:5'-3' exoribonuclease 1 isoform X2 [Homalodisca vitripennis]
MGVPKFFRYISERYPCLSEVVREYQLPEFDNLYLDMNGIIHVCSHPNDTDPHFRITEEKIFRDIFHYIETLFRMIQPQKLFFMAVDGVAPRAKMNQQRGRRFRSAKDAEMAEAKARDKGELLPSDDRFDSNCITPGTEFMTRLQAQLKYFVVFKISTDKLWQKVKVILSGHETPGEGEHKIMDYIRYMKSQPGYDPNTRHCLYGLDADLIMLGLCTHEPHFSLLREEVKYGKKNNQKRIPTPEETTFFLLHLSLMREYLDLEFQQLKTTLPFSYDLEHIIDDWVLMSFLVGNDFIPHLPDMHINKGALPILYKTYIDVLPTLGGYINEGGNLRLDRFQKYMEKLASFDFEQFKEISADLRYLESKTGRKIDGKERHSYKNDEEQMSPPKNKDLAALIASTEEMLEGSEDDDDNYTTVDSDEEDEGTSFAEFCAHKNNYYIEKLEYDKVTPEVLRSQGEGYVRAIQWNLNYYYNGCCSWSWFYPHHYAPYISDIKNFSGLKLEYDQGTPFLPFQQLLAVLPAASKKLLPKAYHELMEDDKSPIIDFYPTEFKTDLNGKRQDWEAVVLIPFIDQESLLQAMETKEHELTDEEKSRNKHGPMQVYTYTPENQGSYIAPAYFPALSNHHAHLENVPREKLYVENSKLVKGLCPGARLDIYHCGFPTLKHIPFKAELRKAKVKVFESASQGDNMILSILPQGHPDVKEVASQLLDKSIYVNWPHMFEARVVGVASEKVRFCLKKDDDSMIIEEMNKAEQAKWDLTRKAIEERYKNRMGINVGKTEILVYACTLEDKKIVMTEEKAQYEKQWSKHAAAYALQTTRTDLEVHEPLPQLNMTLEQLFPVGTVVFSLEPPSYGAMGTVVEGSKNQRVRVFFTYESEPNTEHMKNSVKRRAPRYMPGNQVAHNLGLSPHVLSRITGTIYILSENQESDYKLNIGLNLKFNKRNEEVVGYTKRDRVLGNWTYSHKAEEEVEEYMVVFPEVFEYLDEAKGSEDVRAKDLFPVFTGSRVEELRTFLKERGSAKAERQSCGTEILDEEVVLALEHYIDKYNSDEKMTRQFKLPVKPSNLYLPKPKLGQPPDPKANFNLYDRVINVRECHTVPLGAKGIIIGKHKVDQGPNYMYDILFDKEFTGGLKLRCSPHRGYRLPGQALINLTHSRMNFNNIKGKPTAVVEPSDPAVEASGSNNNGHNSAFASWRSKLQQDMDVTVNSSQQSGVDQKSWRQERVIDQFSRNNRQYMPNNPCQHSAPQQLSNEYFAMFKQLQKAGNTRGGVGRGSTQNVSDPSNELKKILKIADDPTKKQLPPPPIDNRIPMRVSNAQSYTAQLFSLQQKMGMTLSKYYYSETQDGSVVCTITCNGKEYRGAPSSSNDTAAESAAAMALQGLMEEEYWGSHHKRPPPHMAMSSVRHSFPPPNRMPMGHMGEPAKPSTLPQPPVNWCQNPLTSTDQSFQPEWRMGGQGASRSANPHLYKMPQHPSHMLQHPPQNQHMSQRAGHFNLMPSWQNGPPPFIPLQAETRFRHQSQHPPPSLPPPRNHPPPQQELPKPTPPPATSKQTRGMGGPPQGAINTGRTSARPMRSRIAANFSKPFSPQNN